jgi:hypothetical protein
MVDEKKNPLGAVGEQVRANVADLRGGLPYQRLSDRLAELGRRIPPLGLSRIEQGERRVDADDLAALAVALGVNWSRLLLPVENLSEGFPLTPATVVARRDAWGWAQGTHPLPGMDVDPYDWMATTGPATEVSRRWRNPAVLASQDVQNRIQSFLNAMETGDAEAQQRWAGGVRRALARLAAEVDDLLDGADG